MFDQAKIFLEISEKIFNSFVDVSNVKEFFFCTSF